MPFSEIIGHQFPIRLLQTAYTQDRLAHAYLLYGDPQIGKRLTALRFAQALNCEEELSGIGPETCGNCRSCRQIEQGTFPDFLLIEPDRERTHPQIKIDQIREIEHHMMYRPLIGDRKICLIDDADTMTINAANALLKTLEEPPAHSFFLLITNRPSALPATVKSRCQALRFTTPPQTQVEAALMTKRELPPDDARFVAMTVQSRIGEALVTDLESLKTRQQDMRVLVSPDSLQSIPRLLGVAEQIAKEGRIVEAMEWIQTWVRDLIMRQIGGDTQVILPKGDIPAVSEQRTLEPFLNLMNRIEHYHRQGNRNLNLQLALEDILIRLRDVMGYGQGSPSHSRLR